MRKCKKKSILDGKKDAVFTHMSDVYVYTL